MAVDTQTRAPLSRALQGHAASYAATLVSAQIKAFAAAGTLGGEDDWASCDASGGTFIVTLPDQASVLIGKDYTVKEWEGTNLVTVAAAGSGTIDGAATLTISGGEAATIRARLITAAGAVTWDVVSQTAPNPAAGGELLAANNLSDVASAPISRSNLDAGRKTVTLTRVDLIAASAEVYRYVNNSGNSETVTVLSSALTAALATGDATITASINGVPVTTGVITITEVGSAAGDLDSAIPTAANVIANGQVLELTVGGANTAAVFADVSVELTY